MGMEMQMDGGVNKVIKLWVYFGLMTHWCMRVVGNMNRGRCASISCVAVCNGVVME